MRFFLTFKHPGKALALAGTTALLLSSAPAQADDRMSIGGFFGAHIFSDTLELGAYETESADSPQNGLSFGVRAGYELMYRLRLEGELALTATETRDSGDDLLVIGWRTHALVDLLPEEKIRPFALAGIGFLTSSPTAPEVLEVDSDLAFHLGVGAEYDLGENWSLRADARTLFAPTTTSDYLTTDFEFFFGGVKRFPVTKPEAPPDKDGDGVFDSDDKCVDEKEDQDGFQDEDGCPDLDNDGDGVNDDVDQCPAEPESANGIDDADGCPDTDGDGDGVLGSRDKCPTEPEDKDGVEDDDGCPDADDMDSVDAVSPDGAVVPDGTTPKSPAPKTSNDPLPPDL